MFNRDHSDSAAGDVDDDTTSNMSLQYLRESTITKTLPV
jgi:hypothetical protein